MTKRQWKNRAFQKGDKNVLALFPGCTEDFLCGILFMFHKILNMKVFEDAQQIEYALYMAPVL